MSKWQRRKKTVTQPNSQNAIKINCPHELVEHHREHFHRNRELNHFCHGPISRYEEIHMAVFDITQYELVPAHEFPLASLATYKHSRTWGKSSCCGVFAALFHYNDVIMGAIVSQITSLTIVYSTVYRDADQRKLQSSALLAFVRGIQLGPVNSPHKWPVTRKMFPLDEVIMF